MGLLVPFIVLIERRLLRPVWLVLLSTVVLVTGLGAHAGKPGQPRKIARVMDVAINSPLQPGDRWVRVQGGRRMVDAIVVSSEVSTPPTMSTQISGVATCAAAWNRANLPMKPENGGMPPRLIAGMK